MEGTLAAIAGGVMILCGQAGQPPCGEVVSPRSAEIAVQISREISRMKAEIRKSDEAWARPDRAWCTGVHEMNVNPENPDYYPYSPACMSNRACPGVKMKPGPCPWEEANNIRSSYP